jgi:anti-sigma B factor antagonist
MSLSGDVAVTDRDNVRVLTVPRDLDVYVAPRLRQAGVDATTSGHYRIVVDLSGLAHIDSTGMGVLVGMKKRAEAHGGWVRLACVPEHVGRLFRSVGLTKVFVIADTIEGAINWTAPTATESAKRGLTVGEAIIALIPGAEGAGIRP